MRIRPQKTRALMLPQKSARIQYSTGNGRVFFQIDFPETNWRVDREVAQQNGLFVGKYNMQIRKIAARGPGDTALDIGICSTWGKQRLAT
jgi:hypothetical protein